MELPGTSAPLEPEGFGRGYVDHLLLTAPGAGLNLTQKLDPTFVWRPLSVRFQIDTDANVGNRFVTLDYTDPDGNVWVRNAAGLVLTASTVAQVFDFNAQRTVAEWATGTDVLAPLSDFFIAGGWQIKITIGGIKAGDTITAGKLYAEKWLTGRTEAAMIASRNARLARGARR